MRPLSRIVLLFAVYFGTLPSLAAAVTPAPAPKWTEPVCEANQYGSTILLGVLLFGSGGAVPQGDYKRLIVSAREVASGLSVKSIMLIGFADGVGSDAENDRLSLNRAREAARAWTEVAPQLIPSTPPPTPPLMVVGCGSDYPLVKDTPAHPRSENRRVELRALIN